MKLLSILIILSLPVCLSTTVGGSIYLSSLRQTIWERAEREITYWTKHMQSEASTNLGKLSNEVEALAGLKALANALGDG